MKWTHATALVATTALFGAGAVWSGCSSNGGGNDGGGNDAPSNPDTSKPDTGTTDSGGGDTGANDGGLAIDGAALNCAYYCASIMAVCNATSNQQYLDNTTCLSMCAGIPNDAGAGTQSGDSLACRMYHLSVAATSSANADTHCPHAGPYGYGVCGSLCDDFCQQYYATNGPCASNPSYPSADVCRTYCSTAAGADAAAGAPGVAASSPAMLCREYHLENAYNAGGTGGGHCAHAGEDGGGICP